MPKSPPHLKIDKIFDTVTLMKQIPKRIVRQLERSEPFFAQYLQNHREYTISFYIEDYEDEPSQLFYWAWYAQDFGIRVYITMREVPFEHMPRNQARALAQQWPEMADEVKHSKERLIWLHLDPFESEPELLWRAAWYAISRRVRAEVPWPHWRESYPRIQRSSTIQPFEAGRSPRNSRNTAQK